MKHRQLTRETVTTLFPWEDVGDKARQQQLDELQADREHDEWLASLFSANDPHLERWLNEGAPGVIWTMLDSENVLPDYQRDDWVGS